MFDDLVDFDLLANGHKHVEAVAAVPLTVLCCYQQCFGVFFVVCEDLKIRFFLPTINAANRNYQQSICRM